MTDEHRHDESGTTVELIPPVEQADLVGADDFYDLLDIDPDHVSAVAPEDDIEEAYRAASRRYHPDRFPKEERERAAERFKQLQHAKRVLSDKTRKEIYDIAGHDIYVQMVVVEGQKKEDKREWIELVREKIPDPRDHVGKERAVTRMGPDVAEDSSGASEIEQLETDIDRTDLEVSLEGDGLSVDILEDGERKNSVEIGVDADAGADVNAPDSSSSDRKAGEKTLVGRFRRKIGTGFDSASDQAISGLKGLFEGENESSDEDTTTSVPEDERKKPDEGQEPYRRDSEHRSVAGASDQLDPGSGKIDSVTRNASDTDTESSKQSRASAPDGSLAESEDDSPADDDTTSAPERSSGSDRVGTGDRDDRTTRVERQTDPIEEAEVDTSESSDQDIEDGPGGSSASQIDNESAIRGPEDEDVTTPGEIPKDESVSASTVDEAPRTDQPGGRDSGTDGEAESEPGDIVDQLVDSEGESPDSDETAGSAVDGSGSPSDDETTGSQVEVSESSEADETVGSEVDGSSSSGGSQPPSHGTTESGSGESTASNTTEAPEPSPSDRTEDSDPETVQSRSSETSDISPSRAPEPDTSDVAKTRVSDVATPQSSEEERSKPAHGEDSASNDETSVFGSVLDGRVNPTPVDPWPVAGRKTPAEETVEGGSHEESDDRVVSSRLRVRGRKYDLLDFHTGRWASRLSLTAIVVGGLLILGTNGVGPFDPAFLGSYSGLLLVVLVAGVMAAISTIRFDYHHVPGIFQEQSTDGYERSITRGWVFAVFAAVLFVTASDPVEAWNGAFVVARSADVSEAGQVWIDSLPVSRDYQMVVPTTNFVLSVLTALATTGAVLTLGKGTSYRAWYLRWADGSGTQLDPILWDSLAIVPLMVVVWATVTSFLATGLEGIAVPELGIVPVAAVAVVLAALVTILHRIRASLLSSSD